MNKPVASDLLVENFRDEITKFSNFLYKTTRNCLLLLVVVVLVEVNKQVEDENGAHACQLEEVIVIFEVDCSSVNTLIVGEV